MRFVKDAAFVSAFDELMDKDARVRPLPPEEYAAFHHAGLGARPG
jgi:hypothetical protein